MEKALIFDLDGTLVNTLDDITLNINSMLSYFSLKTRTADEVRLMIGNGAKKLVERSLPQNFVDEGFLEEALKVYQNFYDKNLVVNTFVYPGLHDTLAKLKERGVKMSVMSNKSESHVLEIVNKLLPDTFDVVWGHSGRFPHKPDPSCVLEMIEYFGLPKESFAFIGDSKVDILTAKNAKIKSIGVSWGFEGFESLKTCNPDIIISSPKQLLEI